MAALLDFGKSFLMRANNCCSIKPWRLSGIWTEGKLSLHRALCAGGSAELQEVLKALWELWVIPTGSRVGTSLGNKPRGQPGLSAAVAKTILPDPWAL